LSNIDLGGKVLINIFLVGQSEFKTFLTMEADIAKPRRPPRFRGARR